MEIDKEKIERSIELMLHDIGGWIISAEECIGIIDGAQIILKVTIDDDEMVDDPSPELFCIKIP